MRLRRLVLAFAFWTGLGFLFVATARLRGSGMTWTGAFEAVMPQCYAWALVTPVIFAADRRLFSKLPPWQRIFAHFPLALLLMTIPLTVDYWTQKAMHSEWLPASVWDNIVQQSVGGLTSYAIIAGVSMAGYYRAEARRRELHAVQLQSQLAEARLHALQSQLNPHFLFNALNTISAFTETDPRLAREMMACLGKLLRASLDHAGRQEVGLGEELAFLEDYLTIERLRFEGRLTVDVRVDDGARSAKVPSFLLQPLVENAIRHGAGGLRRKCNIRVEARESGGRLAIRVDDDGAGLPHGWRLEDHAGVGLSNIAQRLEELYGAQQKFTVSPRVEGGVRAEVLLPV